MDLSEIWQEHKRFIVTVASGALLFLIASSVVDAVYGADLSEQRNKIGRATNDLNGPLYTAADKREAEEQNEELASRAMDLEGAIAFVPREAFRLVSASPAAAQNSFMDAGERLRSQLGDLASRRRALLPDGLGIVMPGTRNVDVFERHLHALDLLERVVQLALKADVRRVRDVRIELDRAFKSGRSLGALEKTEVTVEVEGDPEAVTQWIAMCETPSKDATLGVDVRGQALPISSLEIRAASVKRSDVLATVTFVVVRIHSAESEDA